MRFKPRGGGANARVGVCVHTTHVFEASGRFDDGATRPQRAPQLPEITES